MSRTKLHDASGDRADEVQPVLKVFIDGRPIHATPCQPSRPDASTGGIAQTAWQAGTTNDRSNGDGTMGSAQKQDNGIPGKTLAVALGLGAFTTLLLRVLTTTWTHSIEAGAIIAGLQLFTFVTVRDMALKQSQTPRK